MIVQDSSSQKRYHCSLVLAPSLSLLIRLDNQFVIALLEAIELVLLHPESYRHRDPNQDVEDKETGHVVHNGLVFGPRKYRKRVREQGVCILFVQLLCSLFIVGIQVVTVTFANSDISEARCDSWSQCVQRECVNRIAFFFALCHFERFVTLQAVKWCS